MILACWLSVFTQTLAGSNHGSLASVIAYAQPVRYDRRERLHITISTSSTKVEHSHLSIRFSAHQTFLSAFPRFRASIISLVPREVCTFKDPALKNRRLQH